jgi:pilus assembly protein Flp/PilA
MVPQAKAQGAPVVTGICHEFAQASLFSQSVLRDTQDAPTPADIRLAGSLQRTIPNQLKEVAVMNMLKKFWNDEQGLSAVEYAVAGGLVILGLVTAFTNLGTAVATRIGELITALG